MRLRTALAVLRGSGRELRTLVPALPSARAAAAAELADRAIRALPPKAADYAAGESDRRADAQNPLLTSDNADATIAPTEHDDGIDSGVPQDAVEMFQHYDDVRNGFKFLSDERFNQLSIPAKNSVLLSSAAYRNGKSA